jgi:hypothetical protein
VTAKSPIKIGARMYKAYVVKIKTRPFPNADKLLLGECNGYQVIVGKETEDGQLGVFFEQGGQLDEVFCANNDLIRRRHPDGSPAGGMFEENRKVRAIKLRGSRSDGFFCNFHHFDYTGYDTSLLKEGDQFDELNGHKICQRFETKATKKAGAANRIKLHKDTIMMPKHFDTGQFKREADSIPAGSIIYISEKMHGTSMRYGHVEDNLPLNFVQKHLVNFAYKVNTNFGNVILKKWTKKNWVHLNGSRNVIIEKRKDPESGFYGKEQFRFKMTDGIALHKGEVIYGEIVGWTENDVPIMRPQGTNALKNKRITKTYGELMTYKYGHMIGECGLYIYRITQVNQDGYQIDLSWPQVVGRCKELGLKTIPVLEFRIYDGNVEKLREDITYLVDGEDGSEALPSWTDPSHIREGVVLRIESEEGVKFLKEKSWIFGVLEGYLKEDEEYVDTEEST